MVGKKERQKKLERERIQRRQDKRAQHEQAVRRWTVSSLAAVVILAVAVGVFFLVRPSGGQAAAASSPAATPSSAASAPASSPAAAAAPVAEPATHCSYVSDPPAARNVGTPPATPDSTAVYQATIHTNRGDIVINLLNSKATCTVNSFVYLASKNYFSNTECQRLTTSGLFVLQCGDPTGTGEGGPGYKFDDENLAGAKYTAGTVAMANAGPNTNGSQFFITVAPTQWLTGKHTVFGEVVEGYDVVEKISKAPRNSQDKPNKPIKIESVVIERLS